MTAMEGSAANAGASLSFHDVCYEVNVGTGPCSCCGKKENKKILKDVSGVFRPGMNAILGPTGSGKTSLLDILAARKEPEGLRGNILIDGRKQPSNFKLMSGYVVQDDVVMGTLTVRENFQFSAALRLPSSISKAEREERVNGVIEELGLSHCADSKVGTELIRGVSGGERKRCNIGMELMTSPPVLFLDEPTTGLDANTANSVMKLLWRLSRHGRTIIFSIHQPRYSIYKLFDSLTLLHKGETVYYGEAKEALPFFESIGFECEEHNNPSDFFLDVVNGELVSDPEKRTKEAIMPQKNGTVQPEENEVIDDGYRTHVQVNGTPAASKGHVQGNGVHAFSNGTYTKRTEEDPSHCAVEMSVPEEGPNLAAEYRNSIYYKRMLEETQPILETYQSNKEKGLKDLTSGHDVSYNTSFLTQLAIVSSRSIKNIVRNPQTSIMQLFTLAVFGLLVGGIYFQVDKSIKSGIQNRVGAFFFIVMNMIFGNLSAVELFIKERVIFIHESANGFYRVSAYFLAKVFCDVLPMRALPVLGFSLISYWMIGLSADAGKFFFFTLNLLLTSLAACGIAFFISASVEVFAIANLCIALSYVLMMLFSGLLVNLDSIGEWIKWAKYLSIFKYSLSSMNVNELKDMDFCDPIPPNSNMTAPICYSGNAFLDQQGIAYKTSWDLWSGQVALAGIAVVFLGLTYVQLRRIKKFK